MTRRVLSQSLVFAFGLALASAGPAHAQDASDWRFESQRREIAPAHRVDAEVRDDGRPTLTLAGGGKGYADGRWTRSVAVEGGSHYRFLTRFRTQSVEEPRRSVLARVLWLDARGEQLGNTEYPATLRTEDGAAAAEGWRTIEQTYLAPEGAAGARLELVYRWDADGSVHFRPATFERGRAARPTGVDS